MKKLAALAIMALLATAKIASPSQVNAAEVETGVATKIETTADGSTVYHVGDGDKYDEVKEDYIVVDGAKYSVDGKKLLAIPAGVTSFTVKEGTEVVNISAIIKHGNIHFRNYDRDTVGVDVKLKNLILPKSLKSIDFETENEYGLGEFFDWGNKVAVEKVTIQNDNLSAEELANMFAYFYKLKPKKLTAPKGVVTYKNKMLIYKKSVIKYYGKGGNVTVPNGVKAIQKYAFTTPKMYESDWQPFKFKGAKIKKITLPKSVKYIYDSAFRNCNKLTTIKFKSTKKLRFVGDYAFYNVKITSFPYMKKLENVGNNAFKGTKLKSITVPSKAKFSSESFGISNFTINIKGN